MTIKELYEYAKKIGKEDYAIEIQYRDDGGCYLGTDETLYPEVDARFMDETKVVIL